MNIPRHAAIVAAVTLLANLLFAYTGVTSTLSCTVTSVLNQVYAASLDMVE